MHLQLWMTHRRSASHTIQHAITCSCSLLQVHDQMGVLSPCAAMCHAAKSTPYITLGRVDMPQTMQLTAMQVMGWWMHSSPGPRGDHNHLATLRV